MWAVAMAEGGWRARGVSLVATLAAAWTFVIPSPAQASVGAAQTANLGLASQGHPLVALEGERLAFTVYEADQGGSDLNGDGDATDRVVHVHDRQTGVTTNVGMDGYALIALGGGRLAFLASEGPGRDLNGDGKTDDYDYVLQVHDPATGVTTNTGLAGSRPEASGENVTFLVGESGQGEDLTGDNDTDDQVAHLYAPSTDDMVNIGVAARSITPLTSGNLAISVDEFGERAVLNGDVDWYDGVVHIYDTTTETLRNLGVSSPYYVLSAYPGGLAWPTAERDQGADLNGDGDQADLLLHVYDDEAGTTTNTGLSTTYGYPTGDGDGRVIALVPETTASGSLNADADTADHVPHVYDTATGATVNLGVASHPGATPYAFTGVGMVFRGSEASEGRSLNADSDTTDDVWQVHAPGASGVTSTGLALGNYHPVVLDNGLLVFHASEAGEGRDLDGTTWSHNAVLHTLDPAAGTTTNLRIPLEAKPLVLTGGRLAVYLSESRANQDFNGDGDRTDLVLHLYDTGSGAFTNGGVAVFLGSHETSLGGDTVAVLGVEPWEGDLNADGDTSDQVVHVVEFRSFVDGDGDTFAPGAGPGDDADDADATVYPGAPELCDGKDNDQDGTQDDGWPDADTDGAADCVDADDDNDGIDDDEDPDRVAALVASLPPSALSSGHRSAMLDRLDNAESLIAAGSTDLAVAELRSLRKRIDGCNGTARPRPDRDDWITDCTSQRQVRAAVDELIASLTS